MSDFAKKSLIEARETLSRFLDDQKQLDGLSKAIDLLAFTYKNEKKVISCGNGGSNCDSMHFAEELTGRYCKNRRPLPAISISDSAHLTCVANDYGYDYVFSRTVEALGTNDDVLLAISTSGNSKNVLNATKVAKSKGMKTIGLLGKDGGELKSFVDIAIIVPEMKTERIQEIHIKIIHILIEGIERELFPELYENLKG
ncbi:D-sedoheptulose 7-phosphate isomerase [Bacteriovoracaceae bacterium]|nr:D-sedoheptulose 7-phosphate isomerase [Bacteriovoracaceae bacterium]